MTAEFDPEKTGNNSGSLICRWRASEHCYLTIKQDIEPLYGDDSLPPGGLVNVTATTACSWQKFSELT